MKERGTTILFVSHDLGSVVNLTERALFFHQGEILMEGSPKAVTAEYQRFCHVSREQGAKIVKALKSAKEIKEEPPPKKAAGTDVNVDSSHTLQSTEQYDPTFLSESRVDYAPYGGEIYDLRLYDDAGEPANILKRRTFYTFEYKIRFTEESRDVTFAMLIKTLKGHDLGGGRTLPWDKFIKRITKGQVYRIKFRFQTLLIPGVYFLNAGVEGLIEGKRAYVHRIMDAVVFRVTREKDLMPTGTVDFLIEPEMELLEDAAT